MVSTNYYYAFCEHRTAVVVYVRALRCDEMLQPVGSWYRRAATLRANIVLALTPVQAASNTSNMLLLLLLCDTNRTLTNLRNWTLCTNGSKSPSQLLQGINSCLRWGAKRAKIEPLGLQLTAKVMSYVVSGSGKEWWSLLHGKSGTKKAAATATTKQSTATDGSSTAATAAAIAERGSGKTAVVHSAKRRKGNSSNGSSSTGQQQQHRSSSKRANSSSAESSLQLQTIQRPQVVLGAGRKKFRKEGEMGVSALS
jgi:hypothetical protein